MQSKNDQLDSDLLDRLQDISPNDLGHRFHFGFPEAAIEYMGSSDPVTVIGQTVTVRAPPEDSAVVHKATEVVDSGEVIAVDMQGHTENAPWGEMTTRAAIESGAEGAIIDGSITDSQKIKELGFPVYARHCSVRTTRLHGRGGDINCPVQIGGATVNPGDIMLGNEDGVLFLPPEKVKSAVQYGEKLHSDESEQIKKLENGKSLAEITGANDILQE